MGVLTTELIREHLLSSTLIHGTSMSLEEVVLKAEIFGFIGRTGPPEGPERSETESITSIGAVEPVQRLKPLNHFSC